MRVADRPGRADPRPRRGPGRTEGERHEAAPIGASARAGAGIVEPGPAGDSAVESVTSGGLMVLPAFLASGFRTISVCFRTTAATLTCPPGSGRRAPDFRERSSRML